MTQAAYHEPATVEEACRLLAEHQPGAHLIAGGVALTLWVKDGVIQPEHVVSLRSIPDLQRITRTADGGLEVGAMVTHRRLETSADALAYSPALSRPLAPLAPFGSEIWPPSAATSFRPILTTIHRRC